MADIGFFSELTDEPAMLRGVKWWTMALNWVEDRSSQMREWRHHRSSFAKGLETGGFEAMVASMVIYGRAMSVLDEARSLCTAKIEECMSHALNEHYNPENAEAVALAYLDVEASFKARWESQEAAASAEYRSVLGWDSENAESFRQNLTSEIYRRCEAVRQTE